jgi:hypothetical protein
MSINPMNPVGNKSVTFSICSTCRVFRDDPRYQANKSYTSNDVDNFRRQAAREGVRIRTLASMVSKSTDTGNALRHLIHNDVIAREELIGIEHLIVAHKASQIADERKTHSSYLSSAHERLAEVSSDAAANADVLASMAVTSSVKHVKEARLRALLAT